MASLSSLCRLSHRLAATSRVTRARLLLPAMTRRHTPTSTTTSHPFTTYTKQAYNPDGAVPGISQWVSSVPQTEEARRKELIWRAKQRGILELDLLVGTFAKERVMQMSEHQIQQLEEILKLESPELLQIILKNETVPAEMQQNELLRELLVYTHEKAKSFSPKVGNQ